jgi:hypothetical protein
LECRQAEDLLPAYALSVLGPEETSAVEEHLETCPWCPPLLRENLLVPEALAHLTDKAELPNDLKKRTMKAVQAQAKKDRRREGPIFAGAGILVGAVASVGILLFASVIAVGVLMSNKIGDLETENSALTGNLSQLSDRIGTLQVENSELAGNLVQLSERDDELVALFRDQLSVTYLLALPSRDVLVLQGGPNAQGMLLVSGRGSSGVLMASGLTPTSESMAYRVWLRQGQQWLPVGHMYVDDRGWGVVSLQPGQPINLFQQVWVTSEGKQDASGTEESKPVLWATIPAR